MTINDNSTKSINAAIIDLQNQIKQLQHKIDILNKNQLKEDDIEFPGKVEYADEAGKAKEADHAKTADTAKYTSETENAVHAGYADNATKATQDASGNVITDTYATKSELTNGLSGKANTSHNHSAADITSGTLAVERGGTGQTTQADINKAFVGALEEGTSDVTDGTMFVSSYASDNGFADTNAVNVPYKRKFSRVWEYIKGKISSVLGLSTDGLNSKGNITASDNKYIRAICASNDYVQIMGSGTSDSGSGEISTGDNGNEPLYARQRDNSNNVTHEITLLDASGNQKFNTVTANGFIGNLSGKANTAGTADYARDMYYQILDLSALSTDNFYPVFFYTANHFAEVAISSPQVLDTDPYNQNRIHFDVSTYGWTDCRRTLNIREYACYSNTEITIGSIGFGATWGGWAIWLRGGLRYNVFTRDAVPELKTSDLVFGDSNSEVYTVGTNYFGGSNINVEIVFIPQNTISNGAYSTRGIKTEGNIIAPNITALEERVAALESKVQ